MSLIVKIKKKFDGFVLDVDFEMEGGCTGILGASGCGKSMTLKCIAGIEKPDSGTIVLNNRVLFDSEKQINLSVQERRVGYLFQNYALFPTMTVKENLEIVQGKKTDKKRVKDMLKRFQLEGLEHRYPAQLSGGQQQRVALARMLQQEPEIIMLDEPFSALDGFLKDTLQVDMLSLLKEYNKDVLLVTHSRDEIFRFCNQMVVISKGRSILKGNTKAIFFHPQKMEAARLTGCKNISPIERRGDYELYALAWGMKLKTVERINPLIRYVGIRGHHMKLSKEYDAKENMMKIRTVGYTETPFEVQYLFCNDEYEECERIWWMKKKDSFFEEKIESLPYLVFPKKALMLLE